MIMDAAIVKAMNLQDLNDYINNKKPEELQTLIALAQKRINQLDQEKEAKYMPQSSRLFRAIWIMLEI